MKRKFQLSDSEAVGLRYVLEADGAEIDDDEEITAVCSSGLKIMFLLSTDTWSSAAQRPAPDLVSQIHK